MQGRVLLHVGFTHPPCGRLQHIFSRLLCCLLHHLIPSALKIPFAGPVLGGDKIFFPRAGVFLAERACTPSCVDLGVVPPPVDVAFMVGRQPVRVLNLVNTHQVVLHVRLGRCVLPGVLWWVQVTCRITIGKGCFLLTHLRSLLVPLQHSLLGLPCTADLSMLCSLLPQLLVLVGEEGHKTGCLVPQRRHLHPPYVTRNIWLSRPRLGRPGHGLLNLPIIRPWRSHGHSQK
mmetsp:Transcript_80092/g.183492  ORF Transcript_80092/g.183492 Transcript_80092/m.183492 type:complete len:231 (-) Transcript_80092:29-721(-)